VYQLTWWIATVPAAGLFWKSLKIASLQTFDTKRILGLILYLLLQEMWFCRFYGRADCHAFSYCAMVEYALGGNLLCYLMHMAMAFFLLFVVQGGRRNIDRNGNLKQSVAFLPYITISFLIFLVPFTSF